MRAFSSKAPTRQLQQWSTGVYQHTGVTVMTKKDLIKQIALQVGHSQTETAQFLQAFTDAIEGSISRGDQVALPGFGTFSVSERQARTARNPQTGEPMTIPAKVVPRFSPGSRLREAASCNTPN